MFKSITEKCRTVNHMNIFNDSISKFYRYSSWGFYWGISMFLGNSFSKKNDKVIIFLGVLKKYVSKNKKSFCSRKKSNVSFNKKILFVFHTIFNLDFITQIIYCNCIIHRCFCYHSYFFCSLISVSKKWNIEKQC